MVEHCGTALTFHLHLDVLRTSEFCGRGPLNAMLTDRFQLSPVRANSNRGFRKVYTIVQGCYACLGDVVFGGGPQLDAAE